MHGMHNFSQSRSLNMLVKSQKLVFSLQSNVISGTFSHNKVYDEGSVKSDPHLQDDQEASK